MKKPRELTHKQKVFVQELLDNPKQSGTAAALKAYSTPEKTITEGSAQQIAFDNLRNPKIVSKLSEANDLVESAIINTVSDWKDEDNSRKREIAMNQAQYIHDKIHGRSKQQVEVQSQQVTINIDLTGSVE